MKYTQYLILGYFLSQRTFAADLVGIEGSKVGLPGPDDIGDVTDKLGSFIEKLQDITAIIAVLGICLVGIMYISSRGNEEKTENAKKYMISIITGVLLAFAAWGIISLINHIPNSFNI